MGKRHSWMDEATVSYDTHRHSDITTAYIPSVSCSYASPLHVRKKPTIDADEIAALECRSRIKARAKDTRNMLRSGLIGAYCLAAAGFSLSVVLQAPDPATHLARACMEVGGGMSAIVGGVLAMIFGGSALADMFRRRV